MRSTLSMLRTRRLTVWSCGFIASFCACLAFAQTQTVDNPNSSTATLPLQISPDGVVALTNKKTPFLLIDADAAAVPITANPALRRIYYTVFPSSTAQRLINADRNLKPANSAELENAQSQRLTGTPLEWQRLALPFNRDPLPTKPLVLKPRQLADALKDGADLQLLDVRPLAPNPQLAVENPPFPQALRFLPHELERQIPNLSKQRWIVVIDSGNRISQPLAERLFKQGFVLVAVLDGGYPAWVAATDR